MGDFQLPCLIIRGYCMLLFSTLELDENRDRVYVSKHYTADFVKNISSLEDFFELTL